MEKEELHLFLDTKSTDYKNMDLISIGIVSDGDHEFYAETLDFNLSWCNEFVISEVLPKLDRGEFAMPYAKIKERLQAWISNLFEEYSNLVLIFNYPWDWFLLEEILSDYLQKHKIIAKQEYLEEAGELYFMFDRTNQHHALHHAKALFYGFRVKYAEYKVNDYQQ